MSGSLKAKSDSCWKLADDLRGVGDFNNCVSRMYYAVFQAVKAYAVLKENYDPEKPEWKNQNAHKVMNGLVKRKLSSSAVVYEEMRVLRNTADYDPEDVSATEVTTHDISVLQGIRDTFLKEAMK